jgi:hypothetical protein
MSRNSRLEASPSGDRAVAAEVPDAHAAEAIESVEDKEFSFHFGPARGILNAVVIGAGTWVIILGTVALTRAIFFG